MTKRAVGYYRISTEDQSNFSLDGQEATVRDYCARNGIELVIGFRDDGQSAKNFDRREWKKLEAFLAANYKSIDYLIVLKYDRFSRNMVEALEKIDVLERAYKIAVVSVNEPIGLPTNSPFFFQLRAQMLLYGDVELRVFRDRTKFGMYQAAKSGRFTSTAPYGYANSRDEQNKPILVKKPEEAAIVANLFEMFLNGATLSEISKLRKCGKSTAQRMLSNPLYAGMVRIPAYNDIPEELGQGLQEPIVDASVWWRVQAKLSGKGKHRLVINEEVPLRGVLCCHCGRPLTAGKSKGRNQYYWYYRCMTHSSPNISANALHQQFDKLLKALELPAHYLKELEAVVVKQLQESGKIAAEQLKQKRKELADVKDDQEQLEQKFIRNQITPEVYEKWNIRLQADKYRLQEEIIGLQEPENHKFTRLREQLGRLNDLNSLYNIGDIHQKQAFIRLMFNNKLRYQNGVFRTTFILPYYHLKATSLKENRLLIIEQPAKIVDIVPSVPPTELHLNHFLNLLEWMAGIAA